MISLYNSLVNLQTSSSLISHFGSTTSLGTQAKMAFAALLILAQGAHAVPQYIKRLQGGREILGLDPKKHESEVCPVDLTSVRRKCHETVPLITTQWTEMYMDNQSAALDGSISFVKHPSFELIDHYLKPVQGLSSDGVRSKFPDNMEAFTLRGFFLVGNGNRGCYLKDRVPFSCGDLINELTEEISKAGYDEAAYTDGAFDYGGRIMEGNGLSMLVGRNPMLADNYRQAVKLLTEKVLHNPCFFEENTPADIIDFLKAIEKTIGKNIASRSEGLGEYRQQRMFFKYIPNIYDDELTDVELTADEIRHYNDASAKIVATDSKVHFSDIFTHKEMQVYKKLNHICPDYPVVPVLLDKFATDLKNFAMLDVHPVALAAWAHCELTSICPFNNSSSTLADLVMNTLLIRGGYNPVVIDSIAEYSAALKADSAKPGAFAEYLVKLIEKQRQEPNLFVWT